jgi:predicted secreted acid phosphatase
MPTALVLRRTSVAALATATALTLAVSAPATAKGHHGPQHPNPAHGHHPGPPLAPRTHFTMAPDGSSGLTAGGAGIPNIDSVKSTIRAYYGASSSGISNKVSSPYISEMHAVEAQALASLPTVDPAAKKAIVFDADDTTLWTYDMEDNAMHFNFDPGLQNTWVQNGLFPASPGMVDFEHAVQAKGYAVFGITGRNSGQEAATLTNLSNVGYTGFDADNFYTKWTSAEPVPAYVDCSADGNAASCSTVEYKAFTRKHIEDSGYDIVLNVGDQFSDLQGGYADRALKLPNPTYYLPSPDIAGAPASDADLTPRTHFTMKPDGSSGLTEGGEGIPNIDSVKSTIRTYYNAPSSGPDTGIANKDTSPYISEMRHVTRSNTHRLVNQCRQELRRGGSPAIVFDADDTTLWTYDMEDGAMRFNFNPTVQDTDWVQPQKFPATPGMVGLVNAVGHAGCAVVGLTGRRVNQRDATLGNLTKVGYTAFTPELYFTKWASNATPDPAIYAGTPCENNGGCSTIEYKSAVRRYVENTLGYDVIANFGDQFSDLIGGYADRTVKLPNPTYYLP